MKPDFLIDVDEVLADFVNPALAIVSRVLGRPWGLDEAPDDTWDMFAILDKDQHAKVFGHMNAQGFCASLQPTPGSQDFIRELRKYRNIYAVTAPHHSSFYWVSERNRWLSDFFDIDKKHVVHTDAKQLCAGNDFLDDNPDHVRRWKARHPTGRAMMWSTLHNKRLKGHEDLRVHSWEEVLRLVSSV